MFLLSIFCTLCFATEYEALRTSLNRIGSTGQIAKILCVSPGTVRHFMETLGSRSPTVKDAYETYLQDQKGYAASDDELDFEEDSSASSEDEDSFIPHGRLRISDNFSSEKVVVVYRGISLSPNPKDSKQNDFLIADNAIGKGLFSRACYDSKNLPITTEKVSDLCEAGDNIFEQIQALKDKKNFKFVRGKKKYIFDTRRDAFQETYSNRYKYFHEKLRAGTEPLFADFYFTSNPLVSCSPSIVHPLKYALGLKEYGGDVLYPLYNKQGTAKNLVVGKLYAVILDAAAIEELDPYNVFQAHQNRVIKLYDHFRNDILSEREIAFAGYIPGEYVAMDINMVVPCFSTDAFPSEYKKSFGFTKTRWGNMRKKILKAPGERDIEKCVLGQMIEASSQANDLVYTNALSMKIPTRMATALEKLGASIDGGLIE